MSENGRYALIVAVSDYHEPKLQRLRAPAADAEHLASVLRDPEIGDFDVDLAIDEDEPTLSRRIARFFSNRRPEDLLFLHFSCHGVRDDAGELHLATTDTEIGDLLGVTSIASSWLSGQIGRSRSKRIVVLLDCCFSGAFPFGVRARAGTDVDVRGALEGRGRAVITASSSMEYAFEGNELSGEGQPSIFTSAVVEALATGKADRDQDGRISIDELYEYVFDQVRERTPNQSPQILSSLEGPLYVARSSYVAPADPRRLDEQLLALVDSPLAGARLGAVAELSRLLGVRDRAVAAAAREQLVRLANDDSQQVCSAARAALDRPRSVGATSRMSSRASTIETTETEAETVALMPARWRTRVAATAIDVPIAVLCGLVPSLVWMLAFPGDPPTAVSFAYFATAVAVGGTLYAALFLRQGGRTVGKRSRSLSVVRLDGTQPSARDMLNREIGKWMLLGLATFLGFGLSLVLVAVAVRLRHDGRPPYDVHAATTVVHDRD